MSVFLRLFQTILLCGFLVLGGCSAGQVESPESIQLKEIAPSLYSKLNGGDKAELEQFLEEIAYAADNEKDIQVTTPDGEVIEVDAQLVRKVITQRLNE